MRKRFKQFELCACNLIPSPLEAVLSSRPVAQVLRRPGNTKPDLRTIYHDGYDLLRLANIEECPRSFKTI